MSDSKATTAEPVATLHRDGYWTHPPGKDPLDFYSQKQTLDVYAHPPAAPEVEGLEPVTEGPLVFRDEPIDLTKPNAALVEKIVARVQFRHTNDCAVHSPTLRPCSCGLETRMREELDQAALLQSRDAAIAEKDAEIARLKK